MSYGRSSGDFFEPILGWRIWRRDAKRQVTIGATDAQAAVAPDVEVRAPDYTDPVVGWRIWRVVRCRGQYLLGSLFNRVAWFPETALEAQCFQSIIRSRAHRSPDLRCHCGIYAAQRDTIDAGLLSQRSLRPLVIGRVNLWGDVLEAEYGWRASRGYPERIFVPRIGAPPKDEDYRIAEGLEAYGVPVSIVSVDSAGALLPTLSALIDGPALAA
jgi:hypothetical protein